MTKDAEELKQLGEKHHIIDERLAIAERNLEALSLESLSSSMLESLNALGIKQADYFSADVFRSYVQEDKSFSQLKEHIEDLKARLLDIQMAGRQYVDAFRAVELQVSKEEEENKRLQDDQNNSIACLEKINEKFSSLITDNQKKLAELLQKSYPYNWAIIFVTQQLQQGKLKPATIQALLKTEVNNVLLSDYIEFKTESQGYFSYKYSIAFTEIGEKVKEYVESFPQRIQKFQQAQTAAVKHLAELFAQKEQELKEIEDEIARQQPIFAETKQTVIEHFSKSKQAADKVLDLIKKAADEIIKAEQLQSHSPAIISSSGNEGVAELEVQVKKFQEHIDQIERGHGARVLQKAYLLQAADILREAKEACKRNQAHYGNARIWTLLPKTMARVNLKHAQCQQQVKQQEALLQQLHTQKNSVENRIREIKQQEEAQQRLAEENQRLEAEKKAQIEAKKEAQQIEAENQLRSQTRRQDTVDDLKEEKKDDAKFSDKPAPVINLAERYREATLSYLSDLSDDITIRLEPLRESYLKQLSKGEAGISQHPYQLLLNSFGLTETSCGRLPYELRELFDVTKDNDAAAGEKRKKIKTILADSEHKPIAAALDKYGLVSKLVNSLGSGVDAFVGLLKDKDNQAILFAHRDRGSLARLQAFLKACGPAIKNIFHGGFHKIYYGGTFFPSGGKRYATDIERISKEKEGPAPKRTRLV